MLFKMDMRSYVHYVHTYTYNFIYNIHIYIYIYIYIYTYILRDVFLMPSNGKNATNFFPHLIYNILHTHTHPHTPTHTRTLV